MNVSDIITRVKRSFGDESAVQIEDDDIIRWINDCQRETVMHNESLLSAVTELDLTVDVNEYEFPEDLFILRSVRIKMSGDKSYKAVEAVNLQQFDRMYDGWDGTKYGTGVPSVYTTYNNKIFIYPTPQGSSTDGLKLLYSKIPTEIVTSADGLSLPLEYHNSVVKYCMAQAHTLDEDYEAKAMHQAEFLGDVRALSYQKETFQQDTYPVITVLEDDRW
jgi:hypothetical protein